MGSGRHIRDFIDVDILASHLLQLVTHADAYGICNIGSGVPRFVSEFVEDLPPDSFPYRPWDIGDNPKTALHEWIKFYPEFLIDKDIDNKLLISTSSDWYLKRVS